MDADQAGDGGHVMSGFKAPIRLKAAIARLQAIRRMGKKQAAEVLGLGKAKAAGAGKVNPKAGRKAKKA